MQIRNFKGQINEIDNSLKESVENYLEQIQVDRLKQQDRLQNLWEQEQQKQDIRNRKLIKELARPKLHPGIVSLIDNHNRMQVQMSEHITRFATQELK